MTGGWFESLRSLCPLCVRQSAVGGFSVSQGRGLATQRTSGPQQLHGGQGTLRWGRLKPDAARVWRPGPGFRDSCRDRFLYSDGRVGREGVWPLTALPFRELGISEIAKRDHEERQNG